MKFVSTHALPKRKNSFFPGDTVVRASRKTAAHLELTPLKMKTVGQRAIDPSQAAQKGSDDALWNDCGYDEGANTAGWASGLHRNARVDQAARSLCYVFQNDGRKPAVPFPAEIH